MFKRYVKSLETRIESLEAFVCSLEYRLSAIDKLPKDECPVCDEIFEVTFEPDDKGTKALQDASKVKKVVEFASRGFKND